MPSVNPPASESCGIGGPDDYLDFSEQHHDVRFGSLADLFGNDRRMSASAGKADVRISSVTMPAFCVSVGYVRGTGDIGHTRPAEGGPTTGFQKKSEK